MSQQDWNDNYLEGALPWDTGKPEPVLVEMVTSGALLPGRGIEIGSGTGTNTIWLASQGFDMLGVDIAPRAIEMAREKATDYAKAQFAVADILTDPLAAESYDFAFDRGCFHIFDESKLRAQFAQHLADGLRPGGLWLSLIGSTEGPARDYGPPRRSARDIVDAIEPSLEILRLESVSFTGDQPGAPAAWMCLARKREMPAQPSTSR
ncbi:MAG: class I SAM-dependent methyltransferase [Leptospiraceae bacterium]|nr:class I SAM-dependent methyltransferase [Leptospiraceae bacterium]MCB1305246.1 class I SAM-dependent methyltransferase [Leptospiraceae bacterium]